MPNSIKPEQHIIAINVGLLIAWHFADVNELLYISLAISLISALWKKAMIAIASSWEKLIRLISIITTSILLSLIYYLILSPTAVISNLVKTNFKLSLKKPSTPSNYSTREKTFEANDFLKPF